MKAKRFLSTVLSICLAVLTLFSFVGCGEDIGYHAKEIEYPAMQTNIEFRKTHTTRGNCYDYELGKIVKGHPDYNDESLPKTRTYVIEDRETLFEIFDFFSVVDFEKEMVIAHFFTSVGNLKKRSLKKVKLDENGALRIEFINHTSGLFNRHTAVIVIKMDKVEFSEIIVQKTKK